MSKQESKANAGAKGLKANARTENKEIKASSKEAKTENKEIKASSKEAKTENKEIKASSKEAKTENKEIKASSKEARAESKEIKGYKIRSRLYTTEELRAKIEEYFNKSVYMQTLDGQKEFEKPKTIEGLAAHLGVSRVTLFDWEKNDEEFAPIIKRAKERISEDMSVRALTGEFKEGFVKFLMTNNHDYKDRQEVLSENVGEIKIKRETLRGQE